MSRRGQTPSGHWRTERQWVLIGVVDIVANVFDPEARTFHRLREVWGQVQHSELAEMPAEA